MVPDFGDELGPLVAALNSPVAAVSAVTTLPPDKSGRAAFRVTLSDSRVLKARILESADRADQVVTLLSGVADRRIARIIGRSGAAILEEWVAGEPFDDRRRPLSAYAEAGSLLATLHATPIEPLGRQAAGRQLARHWRDIVLERVEKLRTLGMLARRQRDAIADLVWVFAPNDCRVGLLYVDFCAENLIVDGQGGLHAVDSETVTIDPVDFDLARTWYRWPMRKEARQAFGEGYRRSGALEPFLAHFPFWAVAVLAGASLAGYPHEPGRASHPIRLLHRIGGHAWAGAAIRRTAMARGGGAYRSFHHAGTVVGVDCDEPGHLAWLEEFLGPQFRSGDCATPHLRVGLEADRTAFSRMNRARALPDGKAFDCFVMDDRVAELAAWIEDDDCRVAWDQELRVFYIVDRNRRAVRVLCRPEELAPRQGLMRIVREVALRQAWRRGELILHAAALALGDKGILVAGPKSSGKSTLLIHLLSGGPARYVSNDRVVLRTHRGAPGVVFGVPTIVALREGTTGFFPWLRERQRARRYRHCHTIAESEHAEVPAHLAESIVTQPSLTPRQFCELVGVPSAARATLAAIVFPRRAADASDGGIVLRELAPDKAAQRLHESLFGPQGAIPGGAFLADIVPCIPSRPRGLAELRQLVSGTRCFDCRLGPDAYARSDAADLLQAIT